MPVDIPCAKRYALRGIRSFCHDGIARFYRSGSKSGISADRSLRLSDALGTHAAFWSGFQLDYDLYQAARKRRVKIAPFSHAA